MIHEYRHVLLSCVVAGICNGVTVSAQDKPQVDPGFVSLFDGKTLAGWKAAPGAYHVEEGKIVCVAGSHGNLLSEREYTDFELRFEFLLTPGANNGLAIRCPMRLDASLHLDGIELQILDDSSEKYASLKPYQYHGSIYGIVPAKKGSLKPVGQWNAQEVIVKGRVIQVILNGEKIVDANLDEATKSGTLDGQEHPGLKRSQGHIGFLGHGDRIEVRHIRIKE
jgi:hypothetical protein